jgi:hypothetical protein
MAYLVSKQQMPDGSFGAFKARPPIESSAVTATALSIRALQLYGKDPGSAIARGREWLRTAKTRTTEEHAMKLLGLTWAKAAAADVSAAAKVLISEQRQDGGWGQLPSLESDAYATGQALVALTSSGQLTPDKRAYARGAAFLLRTQLPDGSWLVRSRVFPFQPYKESGFPHGKHQWISSSGASWAAMALMAGMPPVNQQVSRIF